MEGALKSYEAYRYGGAPLPDLDYREVVNVANMLGGMTRGSAVEARALGAEIRDRVVSEVGKVVVGRERETDLLLTCLLARGHVLLEGVPGVSKTLVANAFSKCLGLQFKRVQFTPDILPLDIIGGFIFNLKDREFEFRKGPVFTNILLADEINRAPPKVQSALLESMQELQVTVEGHTEKLPSPVHGHRDPEPDGVRGGLPPPRGAARQVHGQGQLRAIPPRRWRRAS